MDDEKFMKMLQYHNDLHFCLLIVLYYKRTTQPINHLEQLTDNFPENILADLPPAIQKLLELYDFEKKLSLIKKDRYKELLSEKNDYLTREITTAFSLWKILFRHFAKLAAKAPKLPGEIFSSLKLPFIGELKSSLYAGENFTNDTLSELLCILVQIRNYEEIHIINYEEGTVQIPKCLENVRNDLFFSEDMMDSMLQRITVVQDAPFSFSYLYQYVEHHASQAFILIIGMERFVEFQNNGEIHMQLANSSLHLHTSDDADWKKLLDRLCSLHALIKDHSSFLFSVYVIDRQPDDSIQNMMQYYSDTMSFNLLIDKSRTASSISDREKTLYKEIWHRILQNDRPYERILECEKQLSIVNFKTLKAHYYLSQNDYFHAIAELEQLKEHADCSSNMLLAQLYLMSGTASKAYVILKELYQADRYYPNLIHSILYALETSDNTKEQFSWIQKGMALYKDDPVIVQYLANYYTKHERYQEAADAWKTYYDLTKEPFYILLYEINILLSSLDKSQFKYISSWVNEKVYLYPQYADEIYSRIGNILYDKQSHEKALPYFEKVRESFDEPYCNIVNKKMSIYYHMYFKKSTRNVSQTQMADFISKLIRHILIITYCEQSVYAWSHFVQQSFSYDQWEALLRQMTADFLLELAGSYLNEPGKDTRLRVQESSIANFDSLFEHYEGGMVPNQEKMNIDEYLILVLSHGKAKISQGDIQAANDTAYTCFRLAGSFEDPYHKTISMCFGLLLWSDASMAIGAYAESMLSFLAAAESLLNINEAVLLHTYGIVFEQFLYLYLTSAEITLDAENKTLLEKYFNQIQKPKVILYYLSGMYADIIQMNPPAVKKSMDMMEEANIFISTKEEDLPGILFIDSLILSFAKTGEPNTAANYIRRFYPAIATTLSSSIHIAHFFLLRYLDILAAAKDDTLAVLLFLELRSILEKLREVSFSEERSFLGSSLDRIYRKMLPILCKKADMSKEELTSNDLCSCILIDFVPKSIIEERNRNREMATDASLSEKEQQYYQLFDLLNQVKDKTINHPVYRTIANEFLTLKTYLEQNDPKFKPLKTYHLIGCHDENPFRFLSHKLEKGELFYRNILTEDMLVHLFIDKTSFHVSCEAIHTEQLHALLNRLDTMVNEPVWKVEKTVLSDYVHLFEEITRMLFGPLLNKTKTEPFQTLYYMPDYLLRYVTPNFLRIDDKWGVEYFQNIELVIDYNNIGNHKRNPHSSVNQFFASKSTKGGSQKIRKTLLDFPSYSELIPDEDGHIRLKESVNMLVIAAHGISQTYGQSYYGARKLEVSAKKQTDFNEWILFHSFAVEHALIIACSGGTPTDEKIEQNHGVWNAILKNNVNDILLCKWDVSTEHTNRLLTKILLEMQDGKCLLSEALNKAQRELTDLNPALWAGLEVWKNH